MHGEPVPLDQLYLAMLRMRRFEEALRDLWQRGLISGEMHLGIGEEGVVAGVVAHLEDGDAIAVDHRSTPPFVGRGVDLTSMILEMLGSERGLCRGRGGHMHLFSRDQLAASSGIVGSAAPIASGFALAATHLRPGKVAVGVFGEGAMNQGMVLEAMNLAACWRLPLVLVCKDSGYAITTPSASVTAGSLVERARGLGMRVHRVSGTRVDRVARVAAGAVGRARGGQGPSLIIARCYHAEGHFLGDPILRITRDPVGRDARETRLALTQSLRRGPGASAPARIRAVAALTRSLVGVALGSFGHRDPLAVARRRLPAAVARACESRAAEEVAHAVESALTQTEVAA